MAKGWRSHEDGSHYHVGGRSLYQNRVSNKAFQRNIHFGNETQARESVTYANGRWENMTAHDRSR